MPKCRRAAGSITTAAIIVAMIQVSGPASASAVVRWVAPDGVGTACSVTAPCSVLTAQAQVRAERMSTDLVIRFTSGDYGPITLSPSDSGRRGHVVRYEAAPGAEPSITGARRISGWTLSDPTKNVWRANVPGSFTSRQLYVDGVRASLASKPAADVLGSMTKTATGYTVSKSTMSGWRNLTDAELVFPGGGHDPAPGAIQSFVPWSWSMCGVSNVVGVKIAVDPVCWDKAATILGDMPWFLTKPTIVQNNHALLGTPGQFYLDDRADKVYYVPRSGENLSSATVVMPEGSTLLSAAGTASSPVEDIHISGLIFEYATWHPSPTAGVIDLQANVIGSEASPGLEMIPSAVSFDRTRRIVFERNVVRRVGGGGVSFTRGVDATVRGNVVTDVSSTGISIGDGIAWLSPTTYDSGATVSNNIVKGVAVEYQGGVGIFGGWTQHTKIIHNEVSDLPFMGISLGWGWNNPSGMVDNHIDHNLVRDVHQSSLYDGGAIYVLGAQGDATSSTISSNYVSGDGQPYGALYLDAGASNWIVKNNVVDRAPHGWLYVQNMAGATTRDNLVTSNYADTTKQWAAPLGPSAANSVTGNFLGLSTWPPAAQAIIDAAGLEPAYADLLQVSAPAPEPAPALAPVPKPKPKALTPIKTVKVSVPKTAKAKSKIRVKANGLAAREKYSIRISGKRVYSGTATSKGTVNRRVRIPKSVKKGKRTVTVVAVKSKRKGARKLRIR